LTLLDDAATLSRLPRGLSVSRWSRAVEHLASRVTTRLASVAQHSAAA
jgi:hypothetical protein